MDISRTAVEDSLKSFIAEDLGHGDITSNAIVDANQQGSGRVICKENAVIAGIEESMILLELANCTGKPLARDGQHVKAGATILSVTGPARGILMVERTLLNLLSHMSGVATATADLVSIASKASRNKVRVACTRKSLPGLRYFEKRAVELGGGDTHRLRLDDAVLIKDNHLEFTTSIASAVRTAKSKASFTKKIEVEVTSPDQAVEAVTVGADIVLLDNMTSQNVARALAALKTNNLRDRVIVEVSGGITEKNIAGYAKTGADIISVGAITHSARAIDMSLHVSKGRI